MLSVRNPAIKRYRTRKVGLPPGTLLPPPEDAARETTISYIDYSADGVTEHAGATLDMCRPLAGRESVSWINVTGLRDIDVIQHIGQIFDIHPLVLEDVVSTSQRAKVEEHDDMLFMVLQMLYYDDAAGWIVDEQVSIVLGDHFVITFQEFAGDVFDPVRERIRHGKGRLRKSGADYLAYALVDVIIDNYFIVVERLSTRMELLEDEVFSTAGPRVLEQINALRRQTNLLRHHTRPLREFFTGLHQAETLLIQKTTRPFLRDVADHARSIADIVESFRESIAGMVEHYRSSVNTQMNEVMKFLTIMGSIFIPLTFIAGIYGMNFVHMPELQWTYGYPAVLVVMAVMAGFLLLYFKRRRWI